MRRNFQSLLFIAVVSIASVRAEEKTPPTLNGFDLDALARLLKSEGLTGLVHGAVVERGQFVFSFRDPASPLRSVEFPLITKDKEIRKTLEGLNRNDRITVFGEFLALESPQRHLKVTKLDVVERWKWGERGPNIPIPALQLKALKESTELIGKVHASADGGRILVVDYKGALLFIPVTNTEVTSTLWVNDKIKIQYHVRENPKQPIHLELNEEAKEPVKVMESISELDGKTEKTLTGFLVRYPASRLAKEVYALKTEDKDGVSQFYFLFHDTNADLRRDVDKKVTEWWDSTPKTARFYRSRYVNLGVYLEVTGKPTNPKGAGNPQLIVDSVDNLKRLMHPPIE